MKAVIFDLDGTLLDTLEDLTDSTNRALTKNGFPTHTIDEVRTFVGNGLAVLIERAIPNGRENPLFQTTLKDMQEDYAKNSQVKTKPYDGVLWLINQQHRIVYEVDKDRKIVKVYSMWSHYHE